jgi:hypothetical protein
MSAANGFLRTTLVDLVLGDDAVVASAASALDGRGSWPALVALAAHWRLIPQVREALARAGDAASARVDAPARERLRRESLIRAAESAAIVRQGAEALDLLSGVGVCAIAIKGVAAIATLYGSSSRRMIADVDLVIEEGQLAAARAVLEKNGYTDVSPPFERHVAAIGFSRRLHNYARTFVRNGAELDVHWQFGPRPPAALVARKIIERSVLATVEGRTFRVAGPVEAALLIVHHALRGSFAAYSTPKDLVDLRMWWERDGEARGAELLSEAIASGLGSSLLALARTIESRNYAHPIRVCVAALERTLPSSDVRAAARLETFVEQNLRGESPDNATVELLAPAVFVRSIAGPVIRAIQWRLRGERPSSEPVIDPRRPLLIRVGNRLGRGLRIGRELLRLRRVATYRAVAHAQSRFH